MQIWVQIYGLILDMHNTENAYRIGNNVRRCISVEPDHLVQQHSYLRQRIEINVDVPLMRNEHPSSTSDSRTSAMGVVG